MVFFYGDYTVIGLIFRRMTLLFIESDNTKNLESNEQFFFCISCHWTCKHIYIPNAWVSRKGHNCESLKLTDAVITNTNHYCYQYAITETCCSVSANIKHKIRIRLTDDRRRDKVWSRKLHKNVLDIISHVVMESLCNWVFSLLLCRGHFPIPSHISSFDM